MEGISYPLRPEIKIDFCIDKKKFYFSAPISSAAYRSIRTYVESRKERSFKGTSFHIKDDVVHLMKEVPFYWGPQTQMRHQMAQFRRHLNRCRKILSDMVVEELHESASSSEID